MFNWFQNLLYPKSHLKPHICFSQRSHGLFVFSLSLAKSYEAQQVVSHPSWEITTDRPPGINWYHITQASHSRYLTCCGRSTCVGVYTGDVGVPLPAIQQQQQGAGTELRGTGPELMIQDTPGLIKDAASCRYTLVCAHPRVIQSAGWHRCTAWTELGSCRSICGVTHFRETV